MKESKLEQLMNNCFPKSVGHTYAEVNGVANTDRAMLVTMNKQNIGSLNRNKVVTVDEAIEFLSGCGCPLVIDHFALHCLVKEMRRQFNEKINEYEVNLLHKSFDILCLQEEISVHKESEKYLNNEIKALKDKRNVKKKSK